MPSITLTGNLTRDPELRFTPNGVAVATLRVACSQRVKQADGSYADGDTTFLDVTAWRGLAEVCAEKLRKGDLIMVSGILRMESYEKDGQKRTTYKVEAFTLGDVLRPATSSGHRPTRTTEPDPWAADDIPAF